MPGRRGAVVHRNALKRFTRTLQVNHVVLADGELDGQQQLKLPGLPGREVDDGDDQDTKAREALTETQRAELHQLLLEHEVLFSSIPGKTGVTHMIIDTGTSRPTNIAPYRIPVRWKGKLAEEVKTLLDMGIIKASSSPWAAPVVCVAKLDGLLRMCVDFRSFNKTTVPNPYPMPRIDELVDRVAPATFISTMDLNKGYYQVPLDEDSKRKTAFITPQGKFQFCRMPFGLCNAPAVFQRMMDVILADCPQAAAYIDDIVITSNTWEEHLKDLAEVFRRLEGAGLTVKKAKCAFGKAEVGFLGHWLGGERVRPQQAKLEALQEYATPKTKKDLRAFLGFIGYYRRFVPDFATKSALLTDAISKHQPKTLHWTDEMEAEFQHLKGALVESTSLYTFDPGLQTVIHTDASDRGLGAVLLQVDDEGQERPVAYFSRKLLLAT